MNFSNTMTLQFSIYLLYIPFQARTNLLYLYYMGCLLFRLAEDVYTRLVYSVCNVLLAVLFSLLRLQSWFSRSVILRRCFKNFLSRVPCWHNFQMYDNLGPLGDPFMANYQLFCCLVAHSSTPKLEWHHFHFLSCLHTILNICNNVSGYEKTKKGFTLFLPKYSSTTISNLWADWH